MRVLTIEQLRHQCNIDYEDEDMLLQLCGEAAEDAVIADTKRTYDELLARGYAEKNLKEAEANTIFDGSEFPSRLKMAMLIISAQLFAKREASLTAAQNLVQYSYSYLVKPYRRLV